MRPSVRRARVLRTLCAGVIALGGCHRSSVPEDVRCLAATPPVARAKPDGDVPAARWRPPDHVPQRLVGLQAAVDGEPPREAGVLARWAGADTAAFIVEPLDGAAGVRLRGPNLSPPLVGVARMRVRLRPGGAKHVRVIPFGAHMPDERMQRSHRVVELALEQDAAPDVPVDLVLDVAAVLHGNWTDTLGASGLERVEIELPDAIPEAVRLEEVVVEDERALFASAAAAPRDIERDGIVRPSWFVNSGARVRIALPLPAGEPLLQWSEAGTEASTRSVRVVAGDDVVTLAAGAGASGWQARTASLARFAGRDVIVELSADGTGTAFFGDPTVVVPQPVPHTPDVVVYLVDTLRADALGAWGSPRGDVSPTIDAMAREGVMFSLALSSSSWTKPAIPTLLSGLHPITHGVGATSYTDRLPASVPMMQETFRAAGWRTGSFAASPLGSTLSGLERGFDAAYTPAHWNGSIGDLEHPEARQLHDALLSWVDERPDLPFFAFVHTIEVHEWKRERYGRDRRPGWDGYDAAVHDADHQLGELLAALESRGRRPLVVLLSDHGESFGDHGVNGHGTGLFQSQLHIPLIFRAKNALPAMTVTEPVSLVDVAPTILDLVNLPGLPDAAGTSLASWPRAGHGSGESPRADVTSELTRFVWRPRAPKWRSLVSRNAQKLIRIEGQAPLAFDLARDPCETAPLADLAAKLLPTLEARIAFESTTRAEFLSRHGEGPRAAVDAGDVERLRALGYVE